MNSPESTALAEELRPALLRLYRQMRRDSEAHGLSLLQNMLIGLIQRRPGITVGELAEIECLRGPTMSGHVKQMEAAGLVMREPRDPSDRRRVGLVVTERGTALLETIRRQRTDWLAERLERLDAAGQQAIAAALGPLAALGQ